MDHQTEIILTVLGIAFVHGLVFYLVSRKPRTNIRGRLVVVTGGSSGIGLWAAAECVRQGANVTIVARNIKMLGKALSALSVDIEAI